MKMDLYKEEHFYQENGWPTEQFRYCDYKFPIGMDPEWGEDYDQFALVTNALYPFIRLTRKRGQCQSPCGHSAIVAPESTYARKTDKERDKECPKIAWGLTAEFLAQLTYDRNQDDFILQIDKNELIDSYYKKFWELYKFNHSGLKFSNISIEHKELTFLNENVEIERKLWMKSEPLKGYSKLYKYASSIEKDYECFLLGRKQIIEKKIMPTNNSFSTEVREVYETPYIKVFFLDDSVASNAKTVVEALNTVKKVNVTPSNSKDHPGDTLTVYPKSMVDAKTCDKDITDALKRYFSNVSIGNMKVRNEAYFAGIERQILEALENAGATIDVCVAWFTNPILRDKLIEKKKEGVRIRVIRYKDAVNASKGVDLSELDYKEFRGERGGLLHDKFCVIDNVTTISGSYNWTLNAENKNDEDASFHYEDYKFASKFTRRFNQMWYKDESE
jgi:hypothetical protein